VVECPAPCSPVLIPLNIRISSKRSEMRVGEHCRGWETEPPHSSDRMSYRGQPETVRFSVTNSVNDGEIQFCVDPESAISFGAPRTKLGVVQSRYSQRPRS
jgi:hypothetical protein